MPEENEVINGCPGLVKDIWLAVPLHELITTPTDLRKEGDEQKKGAFAPFLFFEICFVVKAGLKSTMYIF